MKNLNVLYELFSHNHQESDGFKGLDIDSKLNNIFERIFTNPDPEYLPHLLFLNLFGKYIIEHDAQYKQMETKLSAAILVYLRQSTNSEKIGNRGQTAKRNSNKMNCFIDPQVYSLKQNDQPSETGVFHSLRPACSDYKYSDIVSLTPAASCMAYEGLLKYIRENLSALDHGSFPFLLFVQRLLCTGFTDTNIPFTNITNGRIAQDPIVSLIQDEAMKEFYKASVTMWACKEHLIDKMPVVSPVPLLPFRFSFSSSSTPIPSSPRKKSSSTEIHSGSSRRHSILLDSLRQKYSKIEEMDRQNNPAKPRERVELTGTALKTLLSILNYLLFRFLNETDVSKRELGQMQLKTNYINHSTTTKANDVPRPNTSLSIPRHLLHLSELNGIDHDKLKRVYSSMFSPTTTTTNPQITTNNNLLALMAVRALEMLHLRACYDCFWEVALGSRCILSQLISKTGN